MNSGSSIIAETALLEAYQDWRQLTELAGEAIRTHNWSLLLDYQNRLSALQARIIPLTAQAREEWQRTGADRTEKENNLRGIVSSLIELELHHSSSLASAKEAARKRLDELEGARQNLKRVQRSYSPMRPAVWNSFS